MTRRARLNALCIVDPLGRILNHVHHETKVDDVRLEDWLIGREVRIPSMRSKAIGGQTGHVAASPAAVVKDG